ncbi:ornithine decarboxylase-like [Acanthaster planci]|uniref:ornithine decarboxylase n=1 Tax=Acanthaster planci TaxID=133434 RepID=A0A8B7Y600_ACAPL|nr:ornithine decarboxylase-like [Acanthaster planci]
MEQIAFQDIQVQVYGRDTRVRDIVNDKVIDCKDREDPDDAFFIGDLGNIVAKHKKWVSALPRVEPFYAVKCNPDRNVLKLLAGLGTNFDCASKSEIEMVLSLGVAPSRIIFANPCKQRSHLKYSAKEGVDLMTFDNEEELHKIKKVFPEARLVLRILTDDSTAQCQLGLKYGCHPKHALYLLQTAKELELDVVGISFHVGSGCRNAGAFAVAIQSARDIFDSGERLGIVMDLLDIGGGFPGQASATIPFEEFTHVINTALQEHFPVSSGVHVIAEPGRFYVASAFTLCVNITAKRMVARDIQTFSVPESKDLVANSVAPSSSDEPGFMYYVNDGVYGSFNCLLYDHATVEPKLLQERDKTVLQYSTSIWGPSCDGLDRIIEHCLMPELEVGEWMIFEDMGAYTMCAGSEFNGFKRPVGYYVLPNNLVTPLQRMFPDSSTPCYQKASLRDSATSLTGSRFAALPAKLVCLHGNEEDPYAQPEVEALL